MLQEKIDRVISKFVRKAQKTGEDWRPLLTAAFQKERGCDPLAEPAAPTQRLAAPTAAAAAAAVASDPGSFANPLFCKKCRVAFDHGSGRAGLCPQKHANFMYTTKLPGSVAAGRGQVAQEGAAGVQSSGCASRARAVSLEAVKVSRRLECTPTTTSLLCSFRCS